MIKNLLFDLGGVIMDIKKDNCVEAFRRLGLPDTSSFFGDYGQHGPFAKIEEGAITVDEFHACVKALIPATVTDAEIDAAFMRFLTGIPVERLRELRSLRAAGYGIYLLSNTNPIMWHGKIAEEFRKEGQRIGDYFDGIVTSFEAKALKPKPKIFEYAMSHLGIAPAETLFLDDSQANLDGAAALGFQTALVPEGVEFADVLSKRLG